MHDIDFPIGLLTFLGLAAGIMSIYWVRTASNPRRQLWGRCLFVLTLVELGGAAMAATLAQAITLAPMGLAAVFLAVAMLWESPAAQWQRE